jgi:predicted ATPase
MLLAMGQMLHGWSGALLDRGDAAIAEFEEGLERWRSAGARLMMPFWMHLLALLLNRAGRSGEASHLLDRALAEAEQSEERWFECELQLLKAAFAARGRQGHGRPDSLVTVRRHLRRALDAATAMGSPSLRLRAAVALGQPALPALGYASCASV